MSDQSPAMAREAAVDLVRELRTATASDSQLFAALWDHDDSYRVHSDRNLGGHQLS